MNTLVGYANSLCVKKYELSDIKDAFDILDFALGKVDGNQCFLYIGGSKDFTMEAGYKVYKTNILFDNKLWATRVPSSKRVAYYFLSSANRYFITLQKESGAWDDFCFMRYDEAVLVGYRKCLFEDLK